MQQVEVDALELLLSHTADVNYLGSESVEIISWAERGGYLNVVKLLLRANFEINTVDMMGRTALDRVTPRGQLNFMRLLLEAEGINVTI
jgi:ankyrin repeat protein